MNNDQQATGVVITGGAPLQQSTITPVAQPSPPATGDAYEVVWDKVHGHGKHQHLIDQITACNPRRNRHERKRFAQLSLQAIRLGILRKCEPKAAEPATSTTVTAAEGADRAQLADLRCERSGERVADVPWNRSLTPCPCDPCTRWLAAQPSP